MQTTVTLKIETQSEFDSIIKIIGIQKMLLYCDSVTANFQKYKSDILDFIKSNSTNEILTKTIYSNIKKKLLTGNVVFNTKELLFIVSNFGTEKSISFDNIVMAAKYFYINKIKPYPLFADMFDENKIALIELNKSSGYRYLESKLSTDEIEFIFGIYRVAMLFESNNVWDKETDKNRALIDYELTKRRPYRSTFFNEAKNFISTFASFAQQKPTNIKYDNVLYDFGSKEVFLMVRDKLDEMMASEAAQIETILNSIIGKDLTILADNEDDYEERYIVEKIRFGLYDFDLHFKVTPKDGKEKTKTHVSNPCYFDQVGNNEKETSIKLLQRIS